MTGIRTSVLRTFPRCEPSTVVLVPLAGGITNRNYTFNLDGRVCVVREPGERTELLGIDRANEAEAAQRAASLGIGPPVVALLDGVGTLVTELVSGRHLELSGGAGGFVSRLPEVVSLIRRFHESGPLAGSFPIHRVVEWHARDAILFGVEVPASFETLRGVSDLIERAFVEGGSEVVACHNDLLPSNVLFGGDRVWLLDFEYAGMNERFFDLGNLSVNCGFDRVEDEELLGYYFGSVTPRAIARLQLMKIMSEFREGMWGVVQQAISTLDTDFVSYAHERLSNAMRLAQSAEFRGLLDEAAATA
jgi:hypothetical protein